MFSKVKNWYVHSVLKKEKKVADRGRAYVLKGEPKATVTAKKFNANTGEWENLEVTNVRVGVE